MHVNSRDWNETYRYLPCSQAPADLAHGTCAEVSWKGQSTLTSQSFRQFSAAFTNSSILSLFASITSVLWCAITFLLIAYFFAVCFLNGAIAVFKDGAGNGEEKADDDQLPEAEITMSVFESASMYVNFHCENVDDRIADFD